MGSIVGGFATTHALTFMQPTEWDDFRARIANSYERRYGHPPEQLPVVLSGIESETDEDNRARYAVIADGLRTLREELTRLRPDAILLVGDDQNENFTEAYLLPQLAIFTGDRYQLGGHQSDARWVRSDAQLARAIVEEAVQDGFDVALAPALVDDRLISHAHYQVIQHVISDSDVAVVPVFVNALHQPAPSPRRCVEFGRSMRRAVERSGDNLRVAVFASGGMSHFTAGFPWPRYQGSFRFGSISETFDREVMTLLRTGDLEALSALTSEQLLEHGNIELRSWLVALGVLGSVPTRHLVYEPFHRGLMGMANATWTSESVVTS